MIGIGSPDPAIKSNFSSLALDLDLDLLLTTSSRFSRLAAAISEGNCEPKLASCKQLSRSVFEASPLEAFVVASTAALHKDDKEIDNRKHFNQIRVDDSLVSDTKMS